MKNEIYFENGGEDIRRTVRRRKKQLYEQIRERMEFYFGDSNLPKDRYLLKLVADDPKVDLSVFLNFNKIRQLTTNVRDIQKALRNSEMLELTEDKSKVFRKTPLKVKENEEACTIYVEQLSCDVDYEWLKKIFSRYGKVDYVSLPKYKNSGKIKGFAFVEFETPEAAKAALDEFEREGCCLTTQMNPEKLCSIATYGDGQFDIKNQLNQPTNDKSVKSQSAQMVESDNELKKTSKRKLKETVDKVEQDEKEEGEPTEKKSKKAKSEESDNNKNEIESENKSNVEEETKPDKDSESQSESKNDSDEKKVQKKKKKNRKKKKSLKMKYVDDIKMYGLQILSKEDWKKLRNKYLNIQREKINKLKQRIYKCQMNDAFKQQQQPAIQVIDRSAQPRFTFLKGAIIKVTFDEPLKDSSQVSQFKCEAKSLQKVEYVDVEVGSKEGYIRFQDSDRAQDAIQSKPWENMTVLEGEEEEQYWEKMKRDRCEKLENKCKFKKRGRNKIIDKTEKLISKKIRLSVDE